MKRFALLVTALALAGCTKTVDEMSYSEVKEYASKLHERCLEQGVKPGPEMQLCINQEARADQAKRRRQREIGEAIAAGAESYSRSVQANRPINCTSTGYGNTVRTTCY